MDLKLIDIVRVFWRRKWIIAITTIVTTIIVAIGTLMATPIYATSATLRVSFAATGSIDYWVYMHIERLMKTHIEIALSRPVLEELAHRLGLEDIPDIEITVVEGTELMRITVEDENPVLAQEVANTLADILVAQSQALYSGGGKTAVMILDEQLTQIEEELNTLQSEYDKRISRSSEGSEQVATLRRLIELKQQTYASMLSQYEQARMTEAMRANVLSIIEPAVIPDAPSKPQEIINIILGGITGLGGGVGLVILFENLDTTLYTTEQIKRVTTAPVMGNIPKFKRHAQAYFFNGGSPEGEAFRRLRVNVLAFDRQAPLSTLMVTSAEPQEGKSTIISNLAFTISLSEHNVVVVDSDMRRPTLHTLFNLSNHVGLSSVLQEETTLDQSLQHSDIFNVSVLTSGPLPKNPAELLASPQMIDLIDQLVDRFDVVLLDAPAIGAVTDAAIIAPMVAGVLLVVGRAHTRREKVQAACQQLADVKARLVGVIVNRVERSRTYAYYQSTDRHN